jgi:hypothetical protein
MSTNRTPVHLVTAKPVGYTEQADFGLHLVLQILESGEFRHLSGQPLKVRDDQCAQRGTTLRCCDLGVAVDVIGNGYGDAFHSFTMSRFRIFIPAPGGSAAAPR